MLELLATYEVDIFYLVGYIHVVCSHFHSDVIVGCQGMGVAFRNTFVGQLTEYHDMKVGARGRTVILLFSRSVVSNSLQPCGLEHARVPCPSPSPRVCSNSCPLSWWCHPTISSSVVPFSSYLQSFPASGSFPMLLCMIQIFSVMWHVSWCSSHPVATVFELQHQSFQWIFRVDFL